MLPADHRWKMIAMRRDFVELMDYLKFYAGHVVRQATGRRINFAWIRSCKPNCATYGITGTKEI